MLKSEIHLLLRSLDLGPKEVLSRYATLARQPRTAEIEIDGHAYLLGQLSAEALERFRVLADETLSGANPDLQLYNLYLYPLLALILAADSRARLPQLDAVSSEVLSLAARELARQFALAALAPQEMAGRT